LQIAMERADAEAAPTAWSALKPIIISTPDDPPHIKLAAI